MSDFKKPPIVNEVNFSSDDTKKEMPTIYCKGKCNHELDGFGPNGGPIIKCKSCKRTFGDVD